MGTLIKFNNMAVPKIVLIFLYVLSIVHCQPLESINQNNDRNVVSKYRLSHDTIPLHYNVKLNLDIQSDEFSGETQIDFEVRKLISNIVLHSKNLIINESATNIIKQGNTLKPNEHIYDEDTEMLHFRFKELLEPGVYTLNLKFNGELAYDYCGLFKSHYLVEGDTIAPFVATHFQLISARRAFPCWDEPAFKATFNISLKHYDNDTALSNMPAYMVEYDESDGKVWTHFETTPVMSTNIVAFIVFNFPNISNSDDTIRLWVREENMVCASYFMEIIERATAELTRYMNSSVGVPKMDHVALPQYSARATENWGLIVYLEFAIPCNTTSVRILSNILNVMTVAHEVTHQWFGNLVSPAWWKYYWLSEGLATYFKYYITDKMFRNWRLFENYLIFEQRNSFSMDEDSDVPCINQNFTSPQSIKGRNPAIIYKKSSVVFWMLSHIIGEDVFRAGLLIYINAHKYGNVTSDDLWEAMQSALNESSVAYEELRIKDVMDTWIEQPGYPLVTVERNYTTSEITIRQEVSPFCRNKIRREWWIPINYATKSVPDFSSTTPTHWLRPDGQNIIIKGIDIDDWIIVNLQQTGYYIVNYEPDNWRKIAQYLNSNDYTKIHVGNRVQILNSAFRQMSKDQFSPAIFLELTNYLRRETDPAVWYSVFKTVPDINMYLRSPRGREILKPHILNVMDKFIKNIDYEELSTDNGLIKLTQLEALSWACRLDHPECKQKAVARLNAYLENPDRNTILSDEEKWIICAALANANQTTWNKYLDLKLADKPDDMYNTLGYLSCTEDPQIMESYLKMTVTENATILNFIRPTDILITLNDNVPTNVDAEIDFLMRNFDKIVTITNDAEVILDNLIWKITRRDQIDKLKVLLHEKRINKDSSISYREEAVRKIENEVSQISRWLNKESSRSKTEEPS